MARSLAMLAALLWLLGARSAWAHAIGLSSGEYRRTFDGADVTLTLSRADLLAALPSIDANHDDHVDEHELKTPTLMEFARQALRTSTCRALPQSAKLRDADGIELRVSLLCDNVQGSLAVSLDFLGTLPAGHRHRAQVSNALGNSESLLFERERQLELGPPIGRNSTLSTGPTPLQRLRLWLGYVWLGAEHILSGLDHIAFLLALALGSLRAGQLVRVVSAFTLAHSITLALVTLRIWSVSPALVEPAIALSVAFVAFENLRQKPAWRRALATRFESSIRFGVGAPKPEGGAQPNSLRRGGSCAPDKPRLVLPPRSGAWRSQGPRRNDCYFWDGALVTFAFGLVHGMGFASALLEIEIARSELPAALAFFNVGVEAGQLSLLLLLVPLLALARKWSGFSARVAPACSLALVACGLCWFVARLA
ncbi:MAG: HupE/UreJ family protein [Myxococcota bacterium]